MPRRAHALCMVAAFGLATSSATAQAACQPTEPGQLARLLSTADAAFGDLDADSFREALAQARAAVPCLSAPLSAGQVAAYHRAEAYESFLNRDHASTVQHFRAMLAASPGYQLSELVAPENHPLRTDFEIAEGLPADTGRSLPQPVTGSLRVDGRASEGGPATLPFVLQHVDDEGKVLSSNLVEAGSTLLSYEAVEEQQARVRNSSSKRRLGPPLVAAALVTGATSAALYGMSSSKANSFWDPATSEAELDQLRRQTNGMAYASVGVGVVAIGVGTAAVLSFAW